MSSFPFVSTFLIDATPTPSSVLFTLLFLLGSISPHETSTKLKESTNNLLNFLIFITPVLLY